MKPACQFLTLVFFLTSGILMFSADDENSKNWTSLPESARKEILSSLAQQFPMPDNKKAAPESEYQQTLKKWKSNVEKQKDFLARHWLKTHQGDSDKAIDTANASPTIVAAQPRLKPSPAAKEIKPIRTTEKAADTPLSEPVEAYANDKKYVPDVKDKSTAIENLTIHFKKTVLGGDIIKNVQFPNKMFTGRSDAPVMGGRPVSEKLTDAKYGTLFLGMSAPLSAVAYKSVPSGKYDRFVIDQNMDRDLSNDPVIALSDKVPEQEISIKVGGSQETFIIRNPNPANPSFTLAAKYIMVGDLNYDGRNVKALLVPGYQGLISYGSRLVIDFNGNGVMDPLGDKPESLPISKYMMMDGAFYLSDIKEDGSSVNLKRCGGNPGAVEFKAKFLDQLKDAALTLNSYSDPVNVKGGSTRAAILNFKGKLDNSAIGLPAETYDNSYFSITKGGLSLAFKYNKMVIEPGKTKTVELLAPKFNILASFAGDMLNIDIRWLESNGLEYTRIIPGGQNDGNSPKIVIETINGTVLYDAFSGWA